MSIPEKPLTVGDLRKQLAHADADAIVGISSRDGKIRSICHVLVWDQPEVQFPIVFTGPVFESDEPQTPNDDAGIPWGWWVGDTLIERFPNQLLAGAAWIDLDPDVMVLITVGEKTVKVRKDEIAIKPI